MPKPVPHRAAALAVVLAVAGCARAAVPPQAAAPPAVPGVGAWPQRTVAGVVAAAGLAPFLVESRADGWVALVPLGGPPQLGALPTPRYRLVVPVEEVRAWTEAVRPLLARETDHPVSDGSAPSLGRGRFRLDVTAVPRQQRDAGDWFALGFALCGRSEYTPRVRARDLQLLLDLLDSAAMHTGRDSALPPTLARAYSAHEVSCPAHRFMGNAVLPLPRDLPAVDRRPVTIGVRFEVDTGGVMVPGSIAFLGDTPPALARAAREAMRLWRHLPADVDIWPVRQVVQTTIAFVPDADLVPDTVRHAFTVSADSDGWVHVRHRLRHDPTHALHHEFFTPDSVERWVRRLLSLTDDSRESRNARPGMPGDMRAVLGSEGGARFVAPLVTVPPSREDVTWIGCPDRGAERYGETEERVDVASLVRWRVAAARARDHRAEPEAPDARVRDAGDVGCPAELPLSPSRLPEFVGVSRAPRLPYPAAMDAQRAEAEVMASFVVDTLGIPVAGTLTTMPGSDPRALASVREHFTELRYRPATRGGVPVRQRVIETFVFEPPLECREPGAAPGCALRYSTVQHDAAPTPPRAAPDAVDVLAARIALVALRRAIDDSIPVDARHVVLRPRYGPVPLEWAAQVLAAMRKPVRCNPRAAGGIVITGCASITDPRELATEQAHRRFDEETGGLAAAIRSEYPRDTVPTVLVVGRDEELVVPVGAVDRWTRDYRPGRGGSSGWVLSTIVPRQEAVFVRARARGARGVLIFHP